MGKFVNEKKRQSIYRSIMLVVIASLVTFIITVLLAQNGTIKYIVSSEQIPTNKMTRKLDALLATVTELIEEKYIGEVDRDALIDGALTGLVESVGDKYTEYYTEAELEDFETDTLGNFVGIGVYMKANFETGYCEVIEPMKNSPALEAGIKAGDIILKLEGKEYFAKDLILLSNDIKGEEGTEVNLTIKRGEETFDLKVKRANVHVNYVSGEIVEDGIGYIQIETFDEDSSKDFKEQYDNLASQDLKGLIIDLRNNGGGVVDEALAIIEMMCDTDETMLISVDKDGKETVDKAKQEREIKVPIVLLTNESTASASEIMVAALKENNKATVVGEKTFGKGVIQEIIYLSNGGALKVTTAEYFTPNRNKINEVGIEPDHEVAYDYYLEDEDVQMDKALSVIKELINK